MLNLAQLQVAIAAAKQRFNLIRKKYPNLKAHLVLSLPTGQAEIDSPLADILSKFPAMVVDDSAKLRVLDLLEQTIKMEKKLKNLSSPDSDAELKTKSKEVARLEDEFRSKFGDRLKVLADQLNMPVYEVKEYLKGLTPNKLPQSQDIELLESLDEIERAQNDKKDLEDQKKNELMALREQLNQLVTKLKYDDNCQVEIRFSELKYALVWKLQTDELVDRKLTPQTRASIRIVLGTLAQFEKTKNES